MGLRQRLVTGANADCRRIERRLRYPSSAPPRRCAPGVRARPRRQPCGKIVDRGASAGLPSASALARAASTAAMKAVAHAAGFEDRHRRFGRAAGRGDVAAQLGRRLGRGGGERRRAGDRLLGEAARRVGRQVPSAARPPAAPRAAGRRRPGPSPTAPSRRRAAPPRRPRSARRSRASRPSRRSRSSSVTAARANSAGDALADQRRRVRHGANDALAAGRGDDLGRCASPAITLSCSAESTLPSARRGSDLEGLRLDRPDDDVGRCATPARRPTRA